VFGAVFRSLGRIMFFGKVSGVFSEVGLGSIINGEKLEC
jgi:hypothetical protein